MNLTGRLGSRMVNETSTAVFCFSVFPLLHSWRLKHFLFLRTVRPSPACAVATRSEVGPLGGARPAHSQPAAGLASSLVLVPLSVNDPEAQGAPGSEEPQSQCGNKSG